MRGLLLLFVLVGAPAVTWAQDAPAPETEVDDAVRRAQLLGDRLRSPFCPGKTLKTCTSAQAMVLRQEILDMAREGLNDEEIIAALQLRYGDEISNPPQPWYTFFVPFLPFVFGGLLVIWVFQRWRKGPRQPRAVAATEPSFEGADAERLARIRAQLNDDDD